MPHVLFKQSGTTTIQAADLGDVIGGVAGQIVNAGLGAVVSLMFMMLFVPQGYRGYTWVFMGSTVGYYCGLRFYMPELGRFLNADAYTDTGTGVVGTNMFAYCNNNPVVFFDPTGEYSASNAVSYANTYWLIPNLKYHYYANGDCANFVSQCLYAGGLLMNENWRYYSSGSLFRKNYIITSSWTKVNELKKYLLGKYGVGGVCMNVQENVKYRVSRLAQYAKIGSLMFFGTSEHSFYHAVIVTRVTTSDIYYTGPTAAKHNYSLFKALSKGGCDYCYIMNISAYVQ